MTEHLRPDGAVLCLCLNPTLQKTLVFDRLAKGEVNRARASRVDASGKGVNVARVLTQIGTRAIHLTQAGGPTRDWFLALCAADGLEVRSVESGSDIRFCHTVIDRFDGTVTELVEEAAAVDPGTAQRVSEAFESALPECSALVLSGTRAPGFPDGLYPALVRRAKAAGLLVVLDIRGADLLACLSEGPDVVKPNLAEFLATWPMAAASRGTGGAAASDTARMAEVKAQVTAIAEELDSRCGTSLVLTRGILPTWYFTGGELREEAVAAKKAVNTIGSGDAFGAGLVASLLEGKALAEAVREGARLGALNAMRLKPGSVAD